MNAYGAGTTVRVAYTVRDATGTAVDPVSQTFTVRRPDGTTYQPTPTNESGAGNFSATIVKPQVAGQWKWSIVTVNPDTEDDGAFFVHAPAAVPV